MKCKQAQLTFPVIQCLDEIGIGLRDDGCDPPRGVIATAGDVFGVAGQANIGGNIDRFDPVGTILLIKTSKNSMYSM